MSLESQTSQALINAGWTPPKGEGFPTWEELRQQVKWLQAKLKEAPEVERDRIIDILDEHFYVYHPGSDDELDADALRANLAPKE